MAEKSCADAIVGLMESYGIDTIFGIPGVHTVAFYRALVSSGLRHVTPRHEQGAALMAYGYGLATGRPAACSVITGPGLLNAATGIGQAYSDSVPMLVVAAANKSNELGMGQGFLHEMPNQNDAARTVTAFNHQLRAPENLPEVFAQTFARFDSGRPRPVGLEVPRDLFDQMANVDGAAWPRTPKPGPDARAVTKAAELLSSAEQPVLLLGGGAKWAGAEALALAERLGCRLRVGGDQFLDECREHPARRQIDPGRYRSGAACAWFSARSCDPGRCRSDHGGSDGAAWWHACFRCRRTRGAALG